MLTVKELMEKGSASLLKTNLKVATGAQDSSEGSSQEVRINFYANKLADNAKKTFAYCLVLQPIL